MGLMDLFNDALSITGVILLIIDLITIVGIFWAYNDGSISGSIAGIIALLLFLVNFLVIAAVTGVLTSLFEAFVSLFNR